MDRKLNGIKYGLVQHIFLPAPCKKSVGGGEMEGGGGGWADNGTYFRQIILPLRETP